MWGSLSTQSGVPVSAKALVWQGQLGAPQHASNRLAPSRADAGKGPENSSDVAQSPRTPFPFPPLGLSGKESR